MANRPDTSNRAPIPEGWAELTEDNVNGSGASVSFAGKGFSARAYQNLSTGEIVIAIGGTEPKLSSAGAYDFLYGNIPGAIGKESKQLNLAADYYETIKTKYPRASSISFTGHSLGGGLASVLAVYFNQSAYVFAPAPFQASADATQTTSGQDIVLDSDGQGKLEIDGLSLGKAKGKGAPNVWVAELGSSGQYVGLALYDDLSSSTGKTLVLTRAGSTDDTITIKNFDFSAATSGGYLGIELETQPRVALTNAGGSNVWSDPSFLASTLEGLMSTIGEGLGRSFTVYLDQAAKAGDTLTLALEGAGDLFQAVLGRAGKQPRAPEPHSPPEPGLGVERRLRAARWPLLRPLLRYRVG